MTLTRTRNFAVFITAVMAFQFLTNILQLVWETDRVSWHWFGVVVFTLLTAAGVVTIVKAIRAIRSFEAENGRDAGRQRPVGDR